MVYLHQDAILFVLDLHRRRVLQLGVLCRDISRAARRENAERKCQARRHENHVIHGITSRPTAKFIWLAALKYEPTRFR